MLDYEPDPQETDLKQLFTGEGLTKKCIHA